MTKRYFYSNSIENFIVSSSDEILGIITRESPFDITDLQRNAWCEEIDILKKILYQKSGEIIFEYSIPRLGKRVDVILLIDYSICIRI